MRLRSLGREHLLEKEMVTHSRILAWEIPWTEEPGGLQSMGSQRLAHNGAHTQCAMDSSGIHPLIQQDDSRKTKASGLPTLEVIH